MEEITTYASDYWTLIKTTTGKSYNFIESVKEFATKLQINFKVKDSRFDDIQVKTWWKIINIDEKLYKIYLKINL